MPDLKRAIEIAMRAHSEQKDRNGQPYTGHVFRVMNMGRTTDEKICGALHDVVEDSDITFDDLKREGFSERILTALKCLTKESPDEDYDKFTERIKQNRLAVCVKLNDLTDNMDIRRMNSLTEKDIARLNKYLKAYRELSELVTK